MAHAARGSGSDYTELRAIRTADTDPSGRLARSVSYEPWMALVSTRNPFSWMKEKGCAAKVGNSPTILARSGPCPLGAVASHDTQRRILAFRFALL